MLEVFILYFSCQEHENPPIHYMDQSFLVAFSVAFPGEELGNVIKPQFVPSQTLKVQLLPNIQPRQTKYW